MDFSPKAITLSDTCWYHMDHPFETTASGKTAKVFADDGTPTRLEIVAPHTQAFKSKTAAHLKRVSQMNSGNAKGKELYEIEDGVLVSHADKKMDLDAQYAADLVVGWENFQIGGKKADFDRAVLLDVLKRDGFKSWLPAAIISVVDDRANFMKNAKES